MLRSTISQGGRVFSIATATNTITWTEQGVLLCSSAVGPELKCAVVPLTFESSQGLCVLNEPRALLCEGGAIYVVGNGQVVLPSGGVTTSMPAVARIREDTLCVFVQVGNGDGLVQETYMDVHTMPCSDSVLLVCGAAVFGSDVVPTATFRRLDICTFLPQGIPGTGLLYSSATTNNTVAVSIAVSPAMGFILLGVQTAATSLVWPLCNDGSPIQPFATSFNDPISGLLRLPAGADGVTVVRMLCTPSGTSFAICAAHGSSSLFGTSWTAVYAFTPDTQPEMEFGISGVACWAWSLYGASLPNEAILGTDGSVVVVGNAFLTQSDLDNAVTVGPDGLPWLQVAVPPGTMPQPFLVRFSASSGRPCCVMQGLGGCIDFLWAAAVVATPTASLLVMGDADSKPGQAGQPAGVLTAFLRPPGAVSCTRALVPIIQTSCTGVVSVDAQCGPTVLMVNGPVVVGDTELPAAAVAGAIRFRAGVFQGFDGTTWRAFRYVD